MAWRLKLHGSSLVILEYVIEKPLREPFIYNSEHIPLLALTVGEGCKNEDKDSFLSKDVRDPLKLFRSDKEEFPSKSRSLVGHSLDDPVEIEVASSPETISVTDSHSHVYSQDDDFVPECKNIDMWLNKHIAVDGYHVVCITKAISQDSLHNPHKPGIEYEVQAWEKGYLHVPNNQTYDASTFADFRRQLENIFSIERTDIWRIKSTEALRRSNGIVDSNSRWAYLPQKWRLFDEYRHPIENLHDINDLQILLLFEGGQYTN